MVSAVAGRTWAAGCSAVVVGDRAPGVLGRAAAGIDVAHSEQNFAAGRLAAPQLGQTMANGVAHSMQNRAPVRFSVPQFEQNTSVEIPEISFARA